MNSESNSIWFLVGYFAMGYLADWVYSRYWSWYFDTTIEGRKPEGAMARLAYRIIDKVWWSYFNIMIIGPEAESTNYEHDLTELTATEVDCADATLSSLVLEVLSKMYFWLSCVLLVGGFGGFLGILLAVVFGHQEIFVWPGICFGSVVGGGLPFFIPSRRGGYCPEREDNSEEIPFNELSPPEVNPAEVVGLGNCDGCGEITWDLPDFS